jgi:hypothetical protein
LEEVLRALGPYTTPLNVILLFGMAWLARDRSKIWAALETAQRELIAEKEKRSDMLDRNYQEFLERGEVMVQTLTDFNRCANEVLLRAKPPRKERKTIDDR